MITEADVIAAHEIHDRTVADGFEAESTRKALERVLNAHTQQFAASRGLIVSRSAFSVDQLIRGRRNGEPGFAADGRFIDHPEWFVIGRKPAAILTHSYALFEDIWIWAVDRGLHAELLPFSCYYPGHTHAVLLTYQGAEVTYQP